MALQPVRAEEHRLAYGKIIVPGHVAALRAPQRYIQDPGLYHLVLHQGVHLGQHGISRAALLTFGHAGRNAGVGDQPGKDVPHVGTVLCGLLPQPPDGRRPAREPGNIDRVGWDN